MAGHEPLHLTGVVAAAGEGGAHHLQESQLFFADAAVMVELFGRDETIHRKVLWAR